MGSEFQGKRVLVTGGARGLGEAIVRAFVDLGATVFALDREEKLLSKLKQSLPQIQTIVVDLTDREATTKAVDELAPIHHLVNNAGIAPPHSLLTISNDLVDTFLAINFKAALYISQVVVNGLMSKKVGGGTIVNVSSVLHLGPRQDNAVYCCTKAATTMLTQCQALEFAPQNMRVNSVAPGWMITGLFTDPTILKMAYDDIANKQTIKLPVKTEDVAELVVFLSSSKSSMITGTEVVIDAGLTLS